MDVIVQSLQSTTEIIVNTSSTSINIGDTPEIILTPDYSIIDISVSNYDIVVSDLAKQGLPGAQGPIGPTGPRGEPLTFDDLTEQQKIELRGDVGSTSTNLVNMFYDSLLS